MKTNRGKDTYQTVQLEAFGSLVNNGVYNEEFEHSVQAQNFFGECIASLCRKVERRPSGLSVLDCGCGPGAWLEFLCNFTYRGKPLLGEYYGFDLTPEMVAIACRRLERYLPRDHLKTGDILLDASYVFGPDRLKFDVVYAYDVVQQLPSRLQLAACRAMLRNVAPSGFLVVFDHDCNSAFGRKMALKKFITMYTKVKLVPPYYCNAKYPPLKSIASELSMTGKYRTEIKVAADGRKCALIVGVI